VAIESPSVRATFDILLEQLEGSIAARVCRFELWNVSQMQGWNKTFGYLVTIQPTGTDQTRKEAIARWSSLPRYLDREIANLREGIKLGHRAKHIVRIVVEQVRQLAKMPVEKSPFFAPAANDQDRGFQTTFRALVNDRINPVALKDAEFLEREYNDIYAT
jgi:uncharacterized protein (DUF885 family)